MPSLSPQAGVVAVLALEVKEMAKEERREFGVQVSGYCQTASTW